MNNAFAVVVIGAILALFGGLFVMGGVMVWQTLAQKGRWGINTNPIIRCPACGFDKRNLERRKPADLHEVLWGGYTCPQCGAKIDKWGRLRSEA